MGGVAALVLAGGRSRRMGGGDKALLRLGDLTLLERVLGALREEADSLAISANGDPARFAGFGLPVIADRRFAGEGPLAGLLAGLDWAAGEGAAALLTVPGDTPFIPPGLAAALAPGPSCAERGGQVHPLVALWPVVLREELAAWLGATPRRAVQPFAADIGMRHVAFDDAGPDPFMNINTPAELDAARRLLEKRA